MLCNDTFLEWFSITKILFLIVNLSTYSRKNKIKTTKFRLPKILLLHKQKGSFRHLTGLNSSACIVSSNMRIKIFRQIDKWVLYTKLFTFIEIYHSHILPMYILLKYLCRCCGYIDSEYEFKSYKLCCILLEYFKVGSLKSESEFIRYSMAQVYNVFLVNTFCIISRYLTQLFSNTYFV